jgi:hypothetical protein
LPSPARATANSPTLVGQRALGYYDQNLLNYYYMASQVRDPFVDDGFANQLNIETIFQELDQNGVSWKIYYSITEGAVPTRTETTARAESPTIIR